jgi:hypothetical protein
MGSEPRRRTIVAAAAACVALAVLATGAITARAATPWWSPVGLSGMSITGVSAIGDTITVRTGGGTTLESTDAGRTFAPVPGNPALPPTGTVISGQQSWRIDSSGRILHATNLAERSAGPLPDPGAPRLGPGADLIAAPAAFSGVVVAVGTDGTVWRRGQDGDWKQALLLLPRSLVQGVPRVTSVTAFTQPLSGAIYLGTDGYAVLISTDGGDDWIRAGPGLPDAVYALSADSGRRAVYAGTSDGLWMHALQALPQPQSYQDAALVWRWIGIGAVTLVAAALTLFGMLQLMPRRVSDPTP